MSEPGWMIPRGWIQSLPASMRSRWMGQAIWQWIGLIGTLLVAGILMTMLYLTGRRSAKRLSSNLPRYLITLIFPITAMLVPLMARNFIVEQLQIQFVPGGAERTDSVLAGLDAISGDDAIDLVAIHDAARPLVRQSDLSAVFAIASQTGAAILATPVSGTGIGSVIVLSPMRSPAGHLFDDAKCGSAVLRSIVKGN